MLNNLPSSAVGLISKDHLLGPVEHVRVPMSSEDPSRRWDRTIIRSKRRKANVQFDNGSVRSDKNIQPGNLNIVPGSRTN